MRLDNLVGDCNEEMTVCVIKDSEKYVEEREWEQHVNYDVRFATFVSHYVRQKMQRTKLSENNMRSSVMLTVPTSTTSTSVTTSLPVSVIVSMLQVIKQEGRVQLNRRCCP
jgi:hypothetical protein